MNPNLHLIEEAVKRVVPDVLALEKGCVIEGRLGYFKGKMTVLDVKEDKSMVRLDLGDDYVHTEEVEGGDLQIKKILGREIRLADVLIAIMPNRSQRAYLQFAQYLLCSPNGWDLKNDNLEAQKEETLSFLAQLLTEKV